MGDEKTTGPPWKAVGALAVALLAVVVALTWQGERQGPTPANPPVSAAGEGSNQDVSTSSPGVAATADDAVGSAEAQLTEAESLVGSIKAVTCFQERAGTTLLPDEEMAPSNVAVQAMEGCLDFTAARHNSHQAIELTVVYYLEPDGTVRETGIGADVTTPEAWDVLEPCAREYWLANPMKVSPSDEQSFSCVYNWSTWSVAGGVRAIGSRATRVLSGRDAPAFGQRMIATP